jgi:hypothetical protein
VVSLLCLLLETSTPLVFENGNVIDTVSEDNAADELSDDDDDAK